MDKNDLLDRLLRLDEEAALELDLPNRLQMVVVGGSALILLGRLSRATYDIDSLGVSPGLYPLLGKYDINTNVEAYINNFPYNFQDRLTRLPLKTEVIDFYVASLEDIVIAKLCSHRDTDLQDVTSEEVRKAIDWNLLEYLATDRNEAKASAMNDSRYAEFLYRYDAYVKRWRPCDN